MAIYPAPRSIKCRWLSRPRPPRVGVSGMHPIKVSEFRLFSDVLFCNLWGRITYLALIKGKKIFESTFGRGYVDYPARQPLSQCILNLDLEAARCNKLLLCRGTVRKSGWSDGVIIFIIHLQLKCQGMIQNSRRRELEWISWTKNISDVTCLMSPYFTGGWLFTILVADSSCWLNWEFMQHESSKYHYTISITAVHPDLLIYKNILSHRIHGTGTGIFTYMKTIKINGIHIP